MLWFIFGYAVFLMISWITFFTKDSKALNDEQFRNYVKDKLSMIHLLFLAQIAFLSLGLIFEWW